MAIDTYTVFYPNTGNALNGESPVVFKSPTTVDPFPNSGASLTSKAFFPVLDFATDVEQTLNIGSQSSGAGAGKITFNPFSITRRVDVISETLFSMCASGAPFKYVDLIQQRTGGSSAAPATFLAYRFGLTAVKTIAWAHSDDAPTETVTFEYGSLSIGYAPQNVDGTPGKFAFTGWDRVKNVKI